MFKVLRGCGALVILALLVGTISVAGTTGTVSGQVTENGVPIAGAQVTAVSPSQSASIATDSNGRFTFISLAPDTYTLSVEKQGYAPVSIAGIAVFADQNQTLPIALQKALKQIAQVTSRSSLSPVRPGTTTDVYSVNGSAAAAAAPLGGGGSLNQLYSAIASMPGAYVPVNQVGVNQTVYIRGGNYDQIGFEYDGIPLNRSFDNYPSGSESTLGQQELEIYTGGGGADANATGLAGFINQVIKSGTYPGYATVGAASGAPAFYHDLRLDAGGASPNRLFSYYVGLSGTNQDFRYFDQYNGADLIDQFPYAHYVADITTNLPFFPAMYPTCSNADGSYLNPVAPGNAANTGSPVTVSADPGCFGAYGPQYGSTSSLYNREAVGNFHFGIPHKHDGGSDDVQVLLMSSANYTKFYSSVNDAGPLGIALVNAGHVNQWPDAYTFPTGTPWLASADTPEIAYMFPGSPMNRCANVTGVPNACPLDASGNQTFSEVPADYRDGRWDTANIVKVQYQKNIGSNAYVRLFGYTFYSNTNRSSANGYGNNVSLGVTNYDYEVDSHTRGLQMQFGDQLSSKHLLSGMVDYLTSSTLRYFNNNNFNTSSQQVSSFTNGSRCFSVYNAGPSSVNNPATGSPYGVQPIADTGAAPQTTVYAIGDPAPCNDPITQGQFTTPFGVPITSAPTETGFSSANPCSDGEVSPTAPACLSGAKMSLTYLGNQGEINAITPKFVNASLTDEWRPNDKLYVSGSVRFDRDEFDLANTNSPATNFWFSAAQKEFCVNPVTRQPLIVPQPPQSISVATPFVALTCPVDTSTGTPIQTVHPDGTDGILLTNNYPSSYTQSYVEPRLSATFTVSPDTVVRASAGRYAQEPQNYEIQYDSLESNLASTLLGFIPFGFSSPLHEAQAQFSNNYDLSYEHHFKGTDISFKLTPYYRWATNQLYETLSLPSLNISPSFNSGTQRTDGIEFEVTKGDFDKNGLAGTFSYTYTNASEKWNNFPDSTTNPIDQYNQDIQEFNALTQAGGGSPCYAPSADGTPDNSCGTASIRNPYYAMHPQTLLNRDDWYAVGLDFPYLAPNTFALVLNYKHDRFSITPAMSLAQGTTYGTPADVQGVDPRACSANQTGAGITTGNPLNADYTSCSHALTNDGTSPGTLYIPNPETGTFDTFGEFRQPWQFNLGLQLSYDISPRITAKVIVANLINRCFGGSSEPWTAAYAPSNTVCGYTSNLFYVGGGFYNGSGPTDTAANGVPLNPYFAHSFVPAYGDVNAFNYPMPLNVYFSVQIKL